MSQQQGFGTGGGGGGDGDVKSICVSENALSPPGTFLAPPVCVFPDANGAISFTADPPIVLTALEHGLNISFSGSGGGIGFIQGNDSVKVGPDGTQTIKFIGNTTQGASVTNTNPNELTVTIANATTTQKGTLLLSDNPTTITGTDSTKAVTPSSLLAKLGSLTANTVLIGGGSSSAIGNSNVGTAGQGLFSNGGTSAPNFGSFTSTDNTILINYNATLNTLDFKGTGSIPGQPNIQFIVGNDGMNVAPDASTHVLQLIGNTTQGVSLTKTGPNQITVTVADATSTQKGVVTLGESGSGISSINEIAPDGANNFSMTTTAPYTLTPITNGLNLSDNGSIPYTYTTASGTNPFVNNNLCIFSDDLAGEFFTRNNCIGLRYADARTDLGGLIRLTTTGQVINGEDNLRAVTSFTLRAFMGPLPANTVLIARGNSSSLGNSSVGTAGMALLSKGGTGLPDFGTLQSPDNSIGIFYDPDANTLNFSTADSLLQGSIQTTGAVTSNLINFPLFARAASFTFEGRISLLCQNEPGFPSGGFQFFGVCKTDGTTGTLIGSPDFQSNLDTAVNGVDAQLAISSNTLQLQVTGVAGLVINWTCDIYYTFAEEGP